MVRCDDFLGKDQFDTYSELIFALCCAKEFYRLGEIMDVSMMSISDFLGEKQKLMLKWLVHKGEVYMGLENEVPKPTEDEPYSFDMSVIDRNQGKLFCVKPDRYEWSNEWIKTQDYGDDWYKLTSYRDLGVILMHLVAHMIVGMKLGLIEPKPIHIVGADGISASTYIYIELLSCTRTMPWFGKILKLDIDYGSRVVDIELLLFVNSGIQAGRRKHWGIKEKYSQLQSEGICPGSICILYERRGVVETNPIGRVTNANIVRVDSIQSNNITVTVIPLYRTKEEVENDFNEIPDASKNMFLDMLDFKVNTYKKTITLYNLGVSTYLYDEDFFISQIDSYGKTIKTVTIDGKRANVELSQRDAIYWLLSQYEVDFDKTLFKQMYPECCEFIYDQYDCHYEDRSIRIKRGTLIG